MSDRNSEANRLQDIATHKAIQMINHPNRSKVASRAHTPGPWRYLEDHEGDAAGRPLTVCDAGNNDLANIYSREDATVDISRVAAIANARLIAAAPDLLTALKAVLFAQQHLLGQFDADDMAAVEAARAAIRKAEGR